MLVVSPMTFSHLVVLPLESSIIQFLHDVRVTPTYFLVFTFIFSKMVSHCLLAEHSAKCQKLYYLSIVT